MIEVANLTKRYGQHTAVDSISFEAKPGEIIGLLGPNGAGKTTTIRMLTGFMPPTDGSAKVAGYDIFEDSFEVRKRVGYLPERVPVYPDMTVRAYVAFWAQMRGIHRPRKQVEVALARVGLLDRQHRLIRHLSKGMRQRLGLAQALVHNPPVVILDEPTIGIDPQQVIEVRESVRALAKSHTVLFSTHILSEAEQVCDRVVILDRGRILAEGKPADLRRRLYPEMSLYVLIGGISNTSARKLLEGVSGVARVEGQGEGFVVRARGDADIRASVSDAIARANHKLLELRPVAMTLEDIFLDIVGKG